MKNLFLTFRQSASSFTHHFHPHAVHNSTECGSVFSKISMQALTRCSDVPSAFPDCSARAHHCLLPGSLCARTTWFHLLMAVLGFLSVAYHCTVPGTALPCLCCTGQVCSGWGRVPQHKCPWQPSVHHTSQQSCFTDPVLLQPCPTQGSADSPALPPGAWRQLQEKALP